MQEDKKTVLAIDDDIATLSFLEALFFGKFRILIARNGSKGLNKALRERPDLILLELLMPKLDGLEICSILRNNPTTAHVPIVVLTKTNDLEMHLKAFALGVDDVLLKPFNPRELIARVNNLLRRANDIKNPVTQVFCGNLEMDLERSECRVSGKLIPLSVLEFLLLLHFASNFNRVLGRKDILKAVWGNSVVAERAVDSRVCVLRKKLQGLDAVFSARYSAGYIFEPKEGNLSRDVESEVSSSAKA